MDFQQIRKYVKGVLTNSFLNKTTLDKLSTSDAGNLLFDGKEISGSGGSETSNYFYLIDYNSMESINSRNFTAEKDCYIEVETYANDNKEEHYYINDIFVGRESINGEVIYLKSFFLSKGDNLKLREGVSHSTTIRIFDLLNNKHNYSTEEQVVGTWIDSKPIYEKTLLFENQYLQNGFTDLDHGISDIDMYIDLKGNYKNLENSNMLLLSHLNTNGGLGFSIGTWCDNTTKIRISTGANMVGNYNIYITIQYTKTTD